MGCNDCPAPSSMTAISEVDCGVDFKQIQRLAFQRVGDTFDATAATPTDIKTLSAWQAKIAAVDSTKIVLTPFIGGDPVITPGTAITNGGGDNSTLNGAEELNGSNPSVFTAVFKSLPAKTIRELKALSCEGVNKLVVYFVAQGGRIIASEVTAGTPDVYTGMPVEGQVFISDRGNNGFGTKDTVAIQFSMTSGWSDTAEPVTPSFSALTDLLTA